MKYAVSILLLAAGMAANAQTPAKPAAPSATAKSAVVATKPAAPAVDAVKLPPGVPPVKAPVKVEFAERYQDIVIGTGAPAEPNKLYKVHYTGWLMADGRKFDSSYDHPRTPVVDKDGKPVLDEDGKPKMGEPQPIQFWQSMPPQMNRGRPIPGWEQGFEGMKVGGKRRLFIPWELAYGSTGRPGPDADHPGIPPKADLIFDVELVEVADPPAMPTRPSMPPGGRPLPGRPGGPLPPGAAPVAPGAPATPGQPGATAAPATPGAPAAPPPSAAPAAPAPAITSAPAAPSTPATTPAQPQPHY
jgi:peptidylprolyl isomerase